MVRRNKPLIEGFLAPLRPLMPFLQPKPDGVEEVGRRVQEGAGALKSHGQSPASVGAILLGRFTLVVEGRIDVRFPVVQLSLQERGNLGSCVAKIVRFADVGCQIEESPAERQEDHHAPGGIVVGDLAPRQD